MAFVQESLTYSDTTSEKAKKRNFSLRNKAAFKRIFDIAFAALVLTISVPILILIAAAIKLSCPGAPVLFRQQRYGLNRKKFYIYKFRTMNPAACNAAFVQAKQGDSRVTWLGGFLRRTSLDEMPQFFNVLRGDMSVVGPRPHVMEMDDELARSIPHYNNRFLVKPGITGLAQCNGFRGPTDTPKSKIGRIARDLAYIRRQNLLLDLFIIMQTTKLCLKSDAF